MPTQVALFYDSIYDALAADVMALGGFKKAGALLWPSSGDAAGKLRSCLSTEHAQKLDLDELMRLKALARDVNSFATVTFEAQLLGYTLEWIKPEDARDELHRQFVEAAKIFDRYSKLVSR
jgi:hypothetical protein